MGFGGSPGFGRGAQARVGEARVSPRSSGRRGQSVTVILVPITLLIAVRYHRYPKKGEPGMLLGGDAKVILRKMMDELKKVIEETELNIDENTLSLKLEDSYRRSDDCVKIIMDIARRYYCGYIMTRDSYDTTPVDAISLTPPVF